MQVRNPRYHILEKEVCKLVPYLAMDKKTQKDLVKNKS